MVGQTVKRRKSKSTRKSVARQLRPDKLTLETGTMYVESETVETLEAAALQLTPADRARLVERLIATLDADPEVEEAWAAEVERRQVEIETGSVSLLPGPETLTSLKAEFRTTPCTRTLWETSGTLPRSITNRLAPVCLNPSLESLANQ